MDHIINPGSTSQMIEVTLRSSTTGQLLTGKLYSDMTIKYQREGAATATILSPVTATLGTWTSSGWKETQISGVYQFGIPNAALAAGVGAVMFVITCAGAIDAKLRIALAPAVNVTLQAGAAVAPADMNGNVPVVLYGTQPAVTFGQVKILANVEAQGALHIVNSSGDGIGQYNSGGFSGLTNSGNSYGTRNETSGNDGVYSEGGSGGYGMNSRGSLGDVYPASGATIDPQDIANAALLAPVGVAADGSVMDYLTDIVEDTDVTLPGLIAASGPGAGSISFPVTVNDESSNPIDGVEVWISTDSAGASVVAGTLHTSALGLATFVLDAGTYYLWRQKSGYNFTNPVAITVS